MWNCQFDCKPQSIKCGSNCWCLQVLWHWWQPLWDLESFSTRKQLPILLKKFQPSPIHLMESIIVFLTTQFRSATTFGCRRTFIEAISDLAAKWKFRFERFKTLHRSRFISASWPFLAWMFTILTVYLSNGMYHSPNEQMLNFWSSRQQRRWFKITFTRWK